MNILILTILAKLEVILLNLISYKSNEKTSRYNFLALNLS